MANPNITNNFSNVKANVDMNLNAYQQYGEKKYVPFSTIVRYGTNRALIFYVVANVYSTYIFNESKSNISKQQKYIYFALSLYVTQMIYNYLDINDDSNLTRLNLSIQP